MTWINAGLVGALGSLVMFVIMMPLIASGIAPFNVAPSAAFLAKLGLPQMPLAPLVHFGYGIFWSLVLVAVFRDKVDLGRGLGLAGVLWLMMMFIYSPIIGWGFFGIGGSAHELAADAPLWIGNPLKFIVATLVLHIIYGGIIGGLNPLWITFEQSEPQHHGRPAENY